MKAQNALVLFMLAGAAVALADGPEGRAPAPEARQVTRVRMVGSISQTAGFGTRASTAIDFYSNVDTSATSYIFYGGVVHTSGEHLFFEKDGYNSLGNPVGPVGSGAKISEVEFWVVASDVSSNAGSSVECSITLEMFDTCVDWLHDCWQFQCECMPSGDESINQVSLGGFYVDLTGPLAPRNGYANGYILDTGSAGLSWSVTDGNGFIDLRCFEYNGGDVPTVLSAAVYPTFNGQSLGTCSYPPGDYPAVGYSVDNFYFDNNMNGIYQRNERFFFGGQPALANLMIRLAGDDGCSFDLDGDGFVNGNDIDYSLELIDAGCPY